MAKQVIEFGLNVRGIDRAIKELKVYRDSLEAKNKKFLEELADIGLIEATIRFEGAVYDRETHTDIEVKPIEDGYVIVASGKDVAFIEYGAGVHYNSPSTYKGKKPTEISEIGTYGKGYGSRHVWGYPDGDGGIKLTHGNPAAMPMWYASEEMRNAIKKTFVEVFG